MSATSTSPATGVAIAWPALDRGPGARAIVPVLVAAGWTRRAGRACAVPLPDPGPNAGSECAHIGAWNHPEHGRPGLPLCAQHALQAHHDRTEETPAP